MCVQAYRNCTGPSRWHCQPYRETIFSFACNGVCSEWGLVRIRRNKIHVTEKSLVKICTMAWAAFFSVRQYVPYIVWQHLSSVGIATSFVSQTRPIVLQLMIRLVSVVTRTLVSWTVPPPPAIVERREREREIQRGKMGAWRETQVQKDKVGVKRVNDRRGCAVDFRILSPYLLQELH